MAILVERFIVLFAADQTEPEIRSFKSEPPRRQQDCPELALMATMAWQMRAYGCAAEARGRDRDVGRSQCNGKLSLQRRQLVPLAAAPEAFDQSVKSPNVVGMLSAALNSMTQPEIVAIDLF